VGWTYLAEDAEERQAVVNMAVNLFRLCKIP
jgi:hypothetical protein